MTEIKSITLRTTIEKLMKYGIDYDTILDAKLLVEIGEKKLESLQIDNNTHCLYEIKNIVIDATSI